MKHIWVVNAFGNQHFKGNPAGVCLIDDSTCATEMQTISTEMGFSNSAFIKHKEDHTFEIRWFTPLSEAPLCGHATIAAMHVLIEEKIVSPHSEVLFESKSGPLFVTHRNGWYNLNFPSFIIESLKLDFEVSTIINQKPLYLGFARNCLFMELEDEEQVKKGIIDLENLKKLDYRALIITAKSQDYDFVSRYFAPKVGIDEDPVCASAHCLLTPFWAQRLQKRELIAFQASPSGGILKCTNLGNRVLISGEAVTVFNDDILIKDLKKLKDVK